MPSLSEKYRGAFPACEERTYLNCAAVAPGTPEAGYRPPAARPSASRRWPTTSTQGDSPPTR